MKFQESQNSPPLSDRRLQLWMLGLVALLGLALFAVKTWRIGAGKQGTSHPHFQGEPPLADTDSLIDEEPGAQSKPENSRIARRRRARHSHTNDAETDADDERRSVNIPARWLADVQANTVGIRQSEADAYHRVLAKLPTVPPHDLQAHAEEVPFVNLMTSPERYRGRPVRLTGELRQLYDIPRAKNDHSVTRLYEAWICTPEAGESPYRVVCREIPRELKPQESSRVDVKVTGYFFKREGYLTQDGRLHAAPTILANSISLATLPHAPLAAADVMPWMVGAISVIGLAMLATVIGYAVGDSRRRRSRTEENLTAADLHRFSAIDRRLSVEESLRRLAEDEWLEEEAEELAATGNGHLRTSDLPDEMIDLPTPFPPTRTPRRFDPSN